MELPRFINTRHGHAGQAVRASSTKLVSAARIAGLTADAWTDAMEKDMLANGSVDQRWRTLCGVCVG